jgi:transmembrane E3 ubiquitin-protein ligase
VLLVAWVALQVLVVVAQDRFGPHFFIPARFLPQKYNYYRAVPSSSHRYEGVPSEEQDGSSGGGGGGSAAGDVETGTGPECAICYNVVDPSERNHMVTPCDHCFHTECLQVSGGGGLRRACALCYCLQVKFTLVRSCTQGLHA